MLIIDLVVGFTLIFFMIDHIPKEPEYVKYVFWMGCYFLGRLVHFINK